MRVLLIFWLLFQTTFLYSQNVDAMKALFLLNFANQTEWPVNYRSGNFIIGVVGNTGVLKELQTLAATKKVGNQSLEVKSFANVSAVSQCHMLFVPGSAGNLAKLIEQTKTHPTLIVTEKDGLIKDGSMINLVFRNNKLAFEVSKTNLNSKGLKITGYLEKLAVVTD